MFAIDIHTRLLARRFFIQQDTFFGKTENTGRKLATTDNNLIFLNHHMKYIQSALPKISLSIESRMFSWYCLSPMSSLLKLPTIYYTPKISSPSMFNIYPQNSRTVVSGEWAQLPSSSSVKKITIISLHPVLKLFPLSPHHQLFFIKLNKHQRQEPAFTWRVLIVIFPSETQNILIFGINLEK